MDIIESSFLALISPKPDVNPEDLERRLLGSVFPSTQLLRRNVSATRHILLRTDKPLNGQPVYVWMTFADLVGGSSQPLPMRELITEEVAQQIEVYGALSYVSQVGTE
jgi:hypothetical protein